MIRNVADAAAFVTKEAGFTPEATLLRMARDGSGPPFVMVDGEPIFDHPDLVAFAAKRKAEFQRRRAARRQG